MEFLTSDDFKKIEEMADLFKMMGHPYKLTIFKHLCDCGCEKMRVKDIYTSLNMQQATASRHLNELKKHSILNRTIDEGKVYYQPNIENEMVDCLTQCVIKIK